MASSVPASISRRTVFSEQFMRSATSRTVRSGSEEGGLGDLAGMASLPRIVPVTGSVAADGWVFVAGQGGWRRLCPERPAEGAPVVGGP